MAKEKDGVTIDFDKAAQYLSNLKAFRNFPSLTKDQRASIRTVVDKIEDQMRSVRTKIGALQEEYKELKSHKSITESEEKAKKILRDCDSEINEAKKGFNLSLDGLTLVPVPAGLFKKESGDSDDTINEKRSYWPLYVELEGVFLTQTDDDGGEPKKGGGGGNG
jgi:hypothetical protein